MRGSRGLVSHLRRQLRLCFTHNHQAMSIYHPVSSSAFVFSCDSANRKDTMIPPRHSAVPCRHLHDAVGACPQDGSCVVGLLFNWRRHTLSLPKFTSSPHNKLPTNCEELSMLSAQRFFFVFRRRRHPQDIPPSNRTALSDSGSRNHLPSPVQTLITSLFIVVLTLSLYRRLSAHNLDFTLLATRLVSVGPAVQT